MKMAGKYVMLLMALLMIGQAVYPQQPEGWVYEREKKGIKVFTRKGRWGRLRDSKAVMVVPSTPEQMLAILTDFNHYSTWFSRCSKSKVVARLSDNEYIVHLVFSAPWPVKDRDCVVRIKIEKDPKTGGYIVTETSEPKYIREEENAVRIQQLVATWKLIPQQDGGTQVVNEYSSNPGGNIPDWLTNTQSVDTPMATFENLQQKASSKK
ncbi:MAG TPA: START domain-containing protein [Chitinophagales bacterium]|nr:START domain-containing protein [Chitinophagales bacterium]